MATPSDGVITPATTPVETLALSADPIDLPFEFVALADLILGEVVGTFTPGSTIPAAAGIAEVTGGLITEADNVVVVVVLVVLVVPVVE